MRRYRSLLMVVGIATIGACSNEKKPPPPPAKEPEPKPEPSPPPPKPEPKQWHAKASLTPVKGAKLKTSSVTFSQVEGDETIVDAEPLAGAKPGAYWLVVHEAGACDPTGAKVGAPWAGSGDANMRIVIGKNTNGGLETNIVRFPLAGDDGAVGRRLVVHEDTKGKPGKVLACGVIESVTEP